MAWFANTREPGRRAGETPVRRLTSSLRPQPPLPPSPRRELSRSRPPGPEPRPLGRNGKDCPRVNPSRYDHSTGGARRTVWKCRDHKGLFRSPTKKPSQKQRFSTLAVQREDAEKAQRKAVRITLLRKRIRAAFSLSVPYQGNRVLAGSRGTPHGNLGRRGTRPHFVWARKKEEGAPGSTRGALFFFSA